MSTARIPKSLAFAIGVAAATSAPAAAQLADLVMTDATNDQLVLFSDLDNNGFYDNTGEIIALYRDGAVAEQRDIQIRKEGGRLVAYWVDEKQDLVMRGIDVDGNGVIDVGEATKFRDSITLDGPSRANGVELAPDGAVWWTSDDVPHEGVFRLKDLNNDKDANDNGEQIVMVPGASTHPIQCNAGPVSINTGSIRRITNLGNGIVAFDDFDYSTWFRFEDKNSDDDVLDAGESTVFLNPTGQLPALDMNPDFAAAVAGSNPRSLALPAGAFAWLSYGTTELEGGKEVVYAACDSNNTGLFATNVFGEPVNGLIFRCADHNNDGDANDAGEVTTFYDGSLSTPAPLQFDKIIGMSSEGGWLYVLELRGNNNRVFHRIADLNGDGDAMDAGEQQQFLWDGSSTLPNPPFLSGNQPFVVQIRAFPHHSWPLATPPLSYCTAKVNSLGCLPVIASTGYAKVGASTGFEIRASNVRNNKNGLLFYGVNGRANAPFQGGTLCVKAQIRRTPAVNSLGTLPPANDCTGVYRLDFSAFTAGLLGGTPLPALNVAGTMVDSQWWGRDPGFPAPNNTTLSNGLEFVVNL
jgi:hypothetical protein